MPIAFRVKLTFYDSPVLLIQSHWACCNNTFFFFSNTYVLIPYRRCKLAKNVIRLLIRFCHKVHRFFHFWEYFYGVQFQKL